MERILETISGLGYRPRRDGTVSASVQVAQGVRAEVTGSASAARAEGTVQVSLSSEAGGANASAEAQVRAADPIVVEGGATALADQQGARRAELRFKLKAGTAAGLQKVTVVVRYAKKAGEAPQEVQLEVPVYVE